MSGNIAEALAAVSTFRQVSESELIRKYIEDGLRQHLKNAENELEREHAVQRDRLRQLKAEIAV